MVAADRIHLAAQAAPDAALLAHVYVTITGKGDSSPDPSVSQFSASIDKQPAKVNALRSANGDKLLFALIVDGSGSSVKAGGEIRQAAAHLFESLSAEGDEGYLVIIVNSQIETSNGIISIAQVQRKLGITPFQGGTAILDAIGDTSKKVLSRAGNPNFPLRAIFLISDGGDNSSRLTRSEAEQNAEEEGVAIFSLAIEPNEKEDGEDASRGLKLLEEVSQATGGLEFFPQRLEDGIPALLNAVHHRWVLDLAPSQVPTPGLHSLQVKNTEKNMRLSAPAKISIP